MYVDEIRPLTASSIRRLLEERRGAAKGRRRQTQRQTPRWAFPGAVEIWTNNDKGWQNHVLGDCNDLSSAGVGVRCDVPLPVGATLEIAIHQPEASFHGQGIVRHCSPVGKSEYVVGLEFQFV